MLRTLGKHGNFHRSLVLHRSSSRPQHSFLKLKQTFVVRQNALLPTRQLLVRSITSTPLGPEADKAKDSIPLPSIPPRKPKVELRPAPVKLPSETGRSTSLPINATPSHSDNAPNDLSQVSSSSTQPKSVVETSQSDIEDASQHGVLVPPPPGLSKIRQLLHQVIQLLKFYFRGVKMINSNRKQVAAIKRRIAEGGIPLSRWESRFMRTYKVDVVKLVPFLIIVLVLEEIIPLIAIYAPFMLPSTCILPSQRERIETAKRARQMALIETSRPTFLSSLARADGPVSLSSLNEQASRALCGLLRLSTVGPSILHRRRIRQHLEYIAQDDQMMIQEDFGAQLTHFELTEALYERGFLVESFDLGRQSELLRSWLTSVSQVQDTDSVSRRICLVVKNAAGR